MTHTYEAELALCLTILSLDSNPGSQDTLQLNRYMSLDKNWFLTTIIV